MASLTRDDHDADVDFWLDLAARFLGVLAALGLALLGAALLFPGSAVAGHLPLLALGSAEPERPLIGLLCFALAGIASIAVLLRRTAKPQRRAAPTQPNGMNFAPLTPTPTPSPAAAGMAPFPAAEPWRAPLPPAPQTEVSPLHLVTRPPPEAAPALVMEEAPLAEIEPTPVMDSPPEPIPVELQAQEVRAEILSIEEPPPAPVDLTPPLEPAADLTPEPDPEPQWAPEPPAALEPSAPIEAAGPAALFEAPDFDARRHELKATLDRAATLASGLASEAADDRQRSLAAQDLGDIAAASGAPDRAGDAYDRALLHARALSETHPGAPAVAAVLADVLIKIGDLNAARGRMGAATDAYEEAVAHRRAAAQANPAEEPCLALADILEKLAKARQDQGQADKARSLYRESLERLTPLVASDTSRYVDLVYRARAGLLALDTGA